MGSPVDDALDRLAHLVESPRHYYVGSTDDIATVRQVLAAKDEELEQLREERDAAMEDRYWMREAEALADRKAHLAEAELVRYREGLREIAEWDGRSAEIHGNRGVREYARALLADSTDGPKPEGGEA